MFTVLRLNGKGKKSVVTEYLTIIILLLLCCALKLMIRLYPYWTTLQTDITSHTCMYAHSAQTSLYSILIGTFVIIVIHQVRSDILVRKGAGSLAVECITSKKLINRNFHNYTAISNVGTILLVKITFGTTSDF